MSRRVRVYWLPCNAVLDFASARWQLPGHLVVRWFDDLPPDASTVAVQCDFLSRTFEFLVESETFEEVPEGDIPPRVGKLHTEMVLLPRGPKGVDQLTPLRLELERLRAIFGDFREDNPAVKLAYEQGVQDGKRLQGKRRLYGG